MFFENSINRPDDSGYDSDEPTPLQRAQDAEIQRSVDARRKLGVVDGRDWMGSLVAPLAKRDVQTPPWETPLCDMSVLRTMKDAGAYFRYLESSGVTWGSLAVLEFDAALAAETPQQTAARLAAEAKHDAEMKMEVINFSVTRKEEKWTKGGTMTFRVPRPCKYAALFEKRICANCNASVPEGQDRCTALKGALVCNQEFAGCWSHTQGTCIYVHPEEPQWADACSGKLCYEREHCGCTSRGLRNCSSNCGIVWSASRFYLKGQEPPQVNRFAAASAANAGGHGNRPPQQAQRNSGGGQRAPQAPQRNSGGGSYWRGGSDTDGWQTQKPRRQ
jgi:hypothetical protein